MNKVPLRTALAYWTKLGFINFGGPAGQIAIMHDELVERRGWISNSRFLHALNYCMLLPGPEAQQLAIYTGWLLNGPVGGIAAGVLFVLPAFFLIMALAVVYALHGDVTWVAAVFYGLRAAVVALVAAAVIRVGRRALRNALLITIAGAAFIAIYLFDVAFPLVIVGAAVVGLVGARVAPGFFRTPPEHGDGEAEAAEVRSAAPTWRRSLLVLVVGLAVWWIPLLLVVAWRGSGDTITNEAFFFSKAALVTFGGAYAVLAYIEQAAVHQYGWLEPGQMVTGLGLAESTPGPLIMVTQFVGFLGAYRYPGGLDPVVAGIVGATVTVWATFAPCFLWIFLGAPFIERLRGNQALNGALTAVTAAVVGVILNLAVTFADVTLLPEGEGPDVFALGLSVAAFVALIRYKVNVLWIVGGSALLGLASIAF